MKASDLVFAGIKGSVIALDRDSGRQVWATSLTGSQFLMGGQFVNVLVEEGKVFATTSGEVFCLDPLSGEQLWHNQLKGYGIGLVTLATVNASTGGSLPALVEKLRQDQHAANAAASSGAAGA